MHTNSTAIRKYVTRSGVLLLASGTNDAHSVHSHVAILPVCTSLTNAYDPIILPNSFSRKTLPNKKVNETTDK